jgi:hypothetical protein
MKQTLALLLTIALLLITAHRLPAPIQEVPEVSPTPKPKREATKSKSEATPKPKVTPSLSFAGTWTGVTIAKNAGGDISSWDYIIKIPSDEKTIWVNWSRAGTKISGSGHQVGCNRIADTLTWTLIYNSTVATETLRITTNETANFVQDVTRSGFFADTWHGTGTFSRQ